jgi:hypothetical protein
MWKLDRWTLNELEELSEAERPEDYEQLMDGEISGSELRGTFSLPATWTFHDDEILDEIMNMWGRREDVWVEEESSDGDAAETSTEVTLV